MKLSQPSRKWRICTYPYDTKKDPFVTCTYKSEDIVIGIPKPYIMTTQSSEYFINNYIGYPMSDINIYEYCNILCSYNSYRSSSYRKKMSIIENILLYLALIPIDGRGIIHTSPYEDIGNIL